MNSMQLLPRYRAGDIAIACLSRPATSNGYELLKNATTATLSRSNVLNDAVTLVRCPDGQRQQRLERECKDGEYLFDIRTQLAKINHSQAANTGSITELFDKACEAFAKGWSHIAVADNLTFRQLEGGLRENEEKHPSLVVLQMSSSDQAEGAPGSSRPTVRAKRFKIPNAVHILVQAVDIEITTNVGYDMRAPEATPFNNFGAFLYDADLPLFQQCPNDNDLSSRVAQARHEALSASPALPPEIVKVIEDMADEDVPLSQLTDAPKHILAQTGVIEIHMLMPCADTPVVQEEVNRVIKNRDEKMSAVIYGWQGQVPATRRDARRLWDRIITENEAPSRIVACFLDSAAAVDKDEYIVIKWNYKSPPFAIKVGVESLVSIWKHHFHDHSAGGSVCKLPLDGITTREVLHHPYARFFPDPPWWRGIETNDDHAPVLLLIDRKAKNTLDDIKSMILSDVEGRKPGDEHVNYRFAEWGEDRDGSIADMLRIANECRWNQSGNYQGGRYGIGNLIFADRQTLDDGKLIMCRYEEEEFDYGEDEESLAPFKGFVHTRTPARRAWIEWVNLHLGNMGWNEIYDDYLRCPGAALSEAD